MAGARSAMRMTGGWWFRKSPPVIVSGEGPYAIDKDGNRLLDGVSGLFTTQIGYSHGKEIGEAAAAQLETLCFYPNWAATHPSALALTERILGLAPDATAEAIRGEWLHSGDMGIRDEEGFIFIQDRLKDMIISGGENVYPAEIENVLLGCPGVGDAAVIGVPSENFASGLSLKVKVWRSSDTSIVSAIRP